MLQGYRDAQQIVQTVFEFATVESAHNRPPFTFLLRTDLLRQRRAKRTGKHLVRQYRWRNNCVNSDVAHSLYERSPVARRFFFLEAKNGNRPKTPFHRLDDQRIGFFDLRPSHPQRLI